MANGSFGMLASVAALSVFAISQPATALTMQECSTKYKTAQDTGAVGSMNWNEFRKQECGADATMSIKKVKAKAPTKDTPSKTAPSTTAAGPSMDECSTRYQAAKSGGTLGGMTWNEFRKAGCVAQAAAPAPKKATHATASTGASTGEGMSEPAAVDQHECSDRYQAAKAAGKLNGKTWNEFRKAGCPASVAGSRTSLFSNAVFPAGVSKKYAGESAGRARLLTCRDQYEANKAAGRTELKWTEEGGGYYSECNKRLSANN